MNATIPIPEVGQLWNDDGTIMRITEVTDEKVRLEAVNQVRQYAIVPRSQWPGSFRYEGGLS